MTKITNNIFHNNVFYDKDEYINDFNDLIKQLSNNSIEIVFRTRIPYLDKSYEDYYGVGKEIRIGDSCITGYHSINQNIINKIKQLIVKDLKQIVENNKLEEDNE